MRPPSNPDDITRPLIPATRPLAPSITRRGRRAKAGGIRLAAACLFLAVGLAEAAEGLVPLRFTASSLEIGETRVSDLSISLAADGRFRVQTARLQNAERELDLAGLGLVGWIDEFEQDGTGLATSGRASYEDLPFTFRFDAKGSRSTLCLKMQAQPLGALVASKGGAEAGGWIRGGEVDACARYVAADGGGGDTIAAELSLQEFAFDSPDGRYAGEGLGIEMSGGMPGGSPGAVRLSGRLHSGAVLFDQLYAEFAASPLRLEVAPQYAGERLDALAFDLADDGAVAVEEDRVVLLTPTPRLPTPLGEEAILRGRLQRLPAPARHLLHRIAEHEGRRTAEEERRTWEGRDEAGRALPSGVYYYSAEVRNGAAKLRKAGKFAVVR